MNDYMPPIMALDNIPLYGAHADWQRIDAPSRATNPPPVHPKGFVTVGRHRAPWGTSVLNADRIASWMQAQS